MFWRILEKIFETREDKMYRQFEERAKRQLQYQETVKRKLEETGELIDLVRKTLEEGDVAKLEAELTKNGSPADGCLVTTCRVEYDRAKGALIIYLTDSIHCPEGA